LSAAFNEATALDAPRSLKLPVVWRCSSLRCTGTPNRSLSDTEKAIGVATMRAAMRWRAASMS
jgi:hypothetical protein